MDSAFSHCVKNQSYKKCSKPFLYKDYINYDHIVCEKCGLDCEVTFSPVPDPEKLNVNCDSSNISYNFL